MAMAALQLQLNKWTGYAFLPFCLIRGCLRKAREGKASLVLVAPVWKSQPWYPALLDLLIDHCLILPADPDLPVDPSNNPHLLVVTGQLCLAVWKLSGKDNLQWEFQEKLPNSWLQDGAMEQT